MNKDDDDSVKTCLGKVSHQIDDCLNKLSDTDRVDFLVSLHVQAKGRLDEIEGAQLRMAIDERARRANHD